MARRIITAVRTLLLAALVAALIAFPTSVAAASVSSSYALTGYEYYATSTEGRFAGTADGSAGDSATWNAIVDHTALTTSATITGGSASIFTTNLVYINGTFSGGSVSLIYQAKGCGIQQYAVKGSLIDVSRSDSAAIGTATFTATLTHYRTRVLGSCIVYAASVSGTMGLDF